MVIKGILITVYGYRVTTVSKMEMVVWIKHKSSVFLAISLWNNEDPSPFFPSEIPKVKKQVVESTVDTEISGIAEEELLQEQVS